jgi:4-amino-4-deoxy-L-arabinose transferase-like glycosyltransferase
MPVDAPRDGFDSTRSQRRWARALCYVFAFGALVAALVPVLTTEAIPLSQQPLPDAAEYADVAYQIANGHGFRTQVDDRSPDRQERPADQLVPARYPPGFPLVLAPWVKIGNNNPTDAQRGARFVAVGLVLALFATAWVLAGPVAAGLAALVAATSPFFEGSARLVMSDAFGGLLTLLVILLVALAWSPSRREPARRWLLVLAGALAGYAVLVRLGAVALLGSLLLSARRFAYVRLMLAGALPFLLFLGVYQWTEFGSPIRTGYDYWLPGLVEFSPRYLNQENPAGERKFIYSDRLDGALMRWTCPCDQFGPMGKASNVVFYPAVLLGMYWVYFPPLFSLLGIWEIWRRRKTSVAQLAAAVVVTNVALHLAYFYQGSRLVAPAALTLLVFGCAGAVRAGGACARRARQFVRGPGEPEPPSSSSDSSSNVASTNTNATS